MPWFFERQIRKWVRLWPSTQKTSGDAPGQLLAIPVNERVATAFGLMKADQERLGRRVPNLDLLIAATAKGARIGFTSFPVNCRKPHRVVSQHRQSHALGAPEGSNRNSRPPTLPTNRRSGCRRLVNSPRLFRVLVSEHDEGIAEILTGLIQMGLALVQSS